MERMKISDYLVVARLKNGKKLIARVDGTDTPIGDFKEIHRHSDWAEIIFIMDLNDPDDNGKHISVKHYANVVAYRTKVPEARHG